MFPWARFPGVDPVLSPEMKSTGEVMGIDGDFATAFAKSQLGGGISCCRTRGTVFVSVKDGDKAHDPHRRSADPDRASDSSIVATDGNRAIT